MSIRKLNTLLAAVSGLLLLVLLPLIGVMLAGHPVSQHLEFPPLTTYVEPAPFAWPVFIGLAALLIAVIGPLVWRCIQAQRGDKSREAAVEGLPPVGSTESSLPPPTLHLPPSTSHLPPSTFHPPPSTLHLPPSTLHLPPSTLLLALGLALGLVTWILAWTRFAWFARFQVFTFSPLWLGYILVVNGLTLRRSGRCMLTHCTRGFILLFPLSAAFWWFFEYLNRFVQNWHYVGIGDLTPAEYVLFATLPFATVLPAVLGTHDLLATIPRLTAGLDRFAPFVPRRPRLIAAVALVLAAVGLALVGVWPDYLFPLLWVSPLVIITAWQALTGRPTLFAPLAHGDWRRIWRLALSALVCGFFWEMWNYGSLAKWVYAVPFVQRFHLFEMPLLGYAGYLPFGLECAIVAELLLNPGLQAPGFGVQDVVPPSRNKDHPGSNQARSTAPQMNGPSPTYLNPEP